MTIDAPAAAPRERVPDAPTLRHLPALDGLRGAAVLAVLAFHGGYLDGGYLGVDLFFVLSGYLITSLLLLEAVRSGTVALGEFWARRCRRLLPALFAVVVVVAIASRSLADPLQWRTIRADGLATLLYVANWHTILLGRPYGAGLGGRSPFEHTWSLAIEEQFYLVWPLVVAAVVWMRRNTARCLLGCSVAVAGASAASSAGLLLGGASVGSLYLGTHARVGAVAVGAAVASAQVDRRSRQLTVRSPALVETVGFVGVSSLIVAWALLDLSSAWLFRGGLVACSLAAGAVVWAITERPTTGPARLFTNVPLREIGLRSYGLYLWHWPIFLWLDTARTGLEGLGLFGLRLLCSGAVACVSYSLVERPVRRLRWPPSQTFLASGAALVAAALVCAAAAVGAPAPAPIQRDRSVPPANVSSSGGVRLAFFGDSVPSILMADGVIPLHDELGVSGGVDGVWGCQLIVPAGPVRDGFGDLLPPKHAVDCARRFRNLVRALRPTPDVVAVMFGGLSYDVRIHGSWYAPCSSTYLDRYRAFATDAIAALGSTGRPLTVVIPQIATSPLIERTYGIRNVAARETCTTQVMAEVAAASGAGVVDLREECDADGACGDLGRDLRGDGIHYWVDDAKAMAAWLVPKVVERARPLP